MAEGEPFETEARIRRVDGVYRWFLIRNVPLRDELDRIIQWYGTGHDTEDLKQAKDSVLSLTNFFGPDSRARDLRESDIPHYA